MTFTGVGYDKRCMGNTMPLNDESGAIVPAVQTVAVPGQLCYLSQERLAFGNMPLFSRVRRVLSMVNKSFQHAVMYQWHVTAKRDTQFVTITPSQGLLAPGQSMLCKVTFTARGTPSFYDLNLCCEVSMVCLF